MQFLADAAPVRVSAECLGTPGGKIKNDDNLIVTLRFANGSIGTLTYHANGDKSLAKERFASLPVAPMLSYRRGSKAVGAKF